MNTSVQAIEHTVVATLLQLIVIILFARVAGSAARAVRQPRAVGEVVAGLLLGPSLLGFLWPDLSGAIFSADAAAPTLILSQIGLILLMFQIGSDFEFGHLRDLRNRRAVVYISIASICVPLVVGLLLGLLTAPYLAPGIDVLTYSLFVGIAFAITAVPVLGRILREYSLTRTETGVIAITAAAANDVVGWVALAGVAAYASARFSAGQSALQIGGILLLLVVLWFVGRPTADWLIRKLPIEDGLPSNGLVAVVLALIFAAGITTEKLGIFTIFGGFLVGLLFHRHHAFVEAWRRQIGQIVLVFFLPIFFTYTGLRTNVLGLDSASDWLWCGAILFTATAVKVLPVYVASRFAGIGGQQSALLGVLMNTRGLMELIVLNIGFSLGFIPQDVFTMLVIMAIATTVMTGPLLQVMLPRAGYRIDKLIEA
ncbi:MAG TPA: cation:proton antiporter [Verrucomicrobiae bacterium]|nr:cation:proton antiporter [Verrucomicrobiae bacterium]